MIKKIKEGIGGELNAEIFETWFPSDAEEILIKIINSGQKDVWIIIPIGDDKFAVTHLTPEYAQRLLSEFEIMRK